MEVKVGLLMSASVFNLRNLLHFTQHEEGAVPQLWTTVLDVQEISNHLKLKLIYYGCKDKE